MAYKITVIVEDDNKECTAHAVSDLSYKEVTDILNEALLKFEVDEEYGPDWWVERN